ncbi:hypothetical protein BH23GEM11_BH23GEM11_16510 [soil metagenome]
MNTWARVRWTLLLTGITAFSGCAALGGSSSQGDPFARGASAGDQLVLRANNTLSEEVSIRVVDGGRTQDLGSVPGRSTRQFTVQWSGSSRLAFQLEPFSGRRHTLPTIAVEPGDLLELVIQSPVERSVIRR